MAQRKVVVLSEKGRDRHRIAVDQVYNNPGRPPVPSSAYSAVDVGFHFRNVSEVAFPSYCLMMLDVNNTDAPSVDADGQPVLRLKVYNGDSDIVFINGSAQVEVGDYGFAQTPKPIMLLRSDVAPTTLVPGMPLGPKPDSTTAFEHSFGFEFITSAFNPYSSKIVLVRAVDPILFGKMDADVAAGSLNRTLDVMNVYSGPSELVAGELVDQSWQLGADYTFIDITSDQFVAMSFKGDKRIVQPIGCPTGV